MKSDFCISVLPPRPPHTIPTVLHPTPSVLYIYLIYYSPENSTFPKVLFSGAFVCCCFFLSVTPQFFTRNIQDTSTKLSRIICRPPEKIKFEYHDSNSLLWLDKSKNPILYLDLDLEISVPSRSLDVLSGIFQHVYSWRSVTLLTIASWI